MTEKEMNKMKEDKIKQLTDEIEAKIRMAINFGIELGFQNCAEYIDSISDKEDA